MLDVSRRLLIVIIMAFCIACMFFSVKTVKAESNSADILTQTKEWVWPATEGRISDHFGTRNGRHKGLDIAAPTGTDTFTVDEGIVTKSYYSSSYGHVIFIKHPNGFETVYAHLSKRLVHEEQQVSKGQLIGKVGNTGRSRGAHLHFEVHNGDWNIKKSNAIDPLHALDVSVFIGEEENDLLAEKQEAAKLAALEEMYIEEQETSDWNLIAHSTEQLLSSSVLVSSDLEEVEEKLEDVVIKVEVIKNMTLWELSQEHSVSIQSIKDWNGLISDIIEIGQILEIYPDKEKVYVVKNGDTLPVVENEVGVSIEKIKELNNLNGDNLYPDQVLVVER
jgi:LysM repeat protein